MAEYNLFGFKFGTPDRPNENNADVKSFAPPENMDGAMELAPGGVYGTYVDMEGAAKTEGELVTRYRDMVLQAECDQAVDDIVNEAIIIEGDTPPVQIDVDAINYSASIKKTIRAEFENVMKLMDFHNKGYEIFRRWYVDGRHYYHMMIDEKNPRDGIKELRYIDPRKIKKVREKKKSKLDMQAMDGARVQLPKGFNEYFLYAPKGLKNGQTAGLKISSDAVVYCHSGHFSKDNKHVLSYLHKAIKPLNQLRMLEDAVVIYRLSRAPERRIFYIDVGNLPKMKAEQYLRDMMVKHKNKLVYDASTGEVRDDRKFMTMLEDFWLPRREGGRGTEITTLPGGQNLGEMEDVDYFRKKLYKSLNVPISRMEAENQFNLGRASEITRDEIKFQKFINRLRSKFNEMFFKVLETQLLLKGITTREEWHGMKKDIFFHYAEDNHYAEMKQGELMRERMTLLNDLDQYVGKYFSQKYVREIVLRQTEREIERIDKEISSEEAAGEYDDDDGEEQQEESFDAVEPFIPPTEPSDDEKRLVEQMSKFMSTVVEDDDE